MADPLSTDWTLSGTNSQTYYSSILPIFDSTWHFWRLKDDGSNDFNVTDFDGDIYTVINPPPVPPFATNP